MRLRRQSPWLSSCFFFFGALLLSASPSRADSILLSESIGGPSLGSRTTGELEAVFGFDLLGNGLEQPKPLDICLGCGVTDPIASLLAGNSFTYDFTAANTPDFTPFVAQLTGTTPGTLWSLSYFFDDSGAFVGGGGGGGGGSFSNASTWTVDFVRLNLYTVSSGGILSDWQVYGSGTPQPAPVLAAEPSTAGLAMIGFVAAAVVRRRRGDRQTS